MSALHISLAAQPVFHLGPVALNNSFFTGIVGSVLILALFILGRRLPAIETICEAILDLIEKVTHDRAKAIKFFPLLMTLFIFILVNNWLGLLPGVGSIVVHSPHGPIPLFRPATADLNTTLALAVISVVTTHVYAIRALGLFSHLKKYISLNPIMLFVGVLELVAEFSKMISFSFRLFGNIFAGEVLLAVISFLVPALAPLPFFFLELFVGLVQALVFTMLSLVFLEIATTAHGEHTKHAEKNHGMVTVESHT